MSLILRKRKFSPRQLFAAGEIGAWYEPGSLDTLYQTSTGTTPVTAGEQPVGLVLDKSKELALGPELVTNGDFSNGTTGWTAVNAVLSVVSGAMRIADNGNATAAYQAVSLTIGKTYKLSFIRTGGTSNLIYGVGTGAPNGISSVVGGTQYDTPSTSRIHLYFVAAATTMYVSFGSFSINYADVDDISLTELPGSHALQSSSTLRPTYKTSPSRLYFDADPDALTITFPSAPGNSTLAYGVSGGEPVITYPVNITGTTYTMNPTNTGANNTGLVIVNRALTAAETVKLTQYLKARS